jgi:hypothetical protein
MVIIITYNVDDNIVCDHTADDYIVGGDANDVGDVYVIDDTL